jgi:thiosulfate dehydrogenase
MAATEWRLDAHHAYLPGEWPMRRLICLISMVAVFASAHRGGGVLAADVPQVNLTEWASPDIKSVGDDAFGKLVKYGYALMTDTANQIGPMVADPAKRFSGNNLTCQNCHLKAGAQPYSMPLTGVWGQFPQYRGREGEVGTLEDRINGCMERSMNGRAADLAHGQQVYQQVCATCHGKDGLGQRAASGSGYQFPPLWGPDSYNNGAGMSRILSAAAFIKNNMPFGTTYAAPVLSDADAYDVAGFINSAERPQRANLDKDFPNRLQKPVDTAYGPYADDFSAEQHKLGPFDPIRAKFKELAAQAAAK